MRAVQFCRADRVKILIEAGADLNAKDKHGDTALARSLAEKFNYGNKTEVISLLTAAGASRQDIEDFNICVTEILAKGIPAAKKALTNSEPCQIIYLRGRGERDSAFKLLMSEFAHRRRHIERRDVSNRSVMYEHWIVVDEYNTEMQNFLKKADLMPPESQSVDYRTILRDSDAAD